MKRIALMVVLLMVVVLIGGCVRQEPERSPYASMDFSARLEVIAPDHYTDLSIDNAGAMGMSRNAGLQLTTASRDMPESRLIALKDLAGSGGFFGLESSYVDDSVDGGTTYMLTITLGNRSNRVTCYEICPDDALTIRSRILEYWGDEL